MGVQGWTKLLAQEGWIPQQESSNGTKNCDCTTSLWRHPDTMQDSLFASRVRPIPPHSSLHIDGNGIIFYLYATAYSRHIQNVTRPKKKNGSNSNNHAYCSHLQTSQLDPSQLRSLLPSFCPLELLAQVTTEFITALQQTHHLDLTVYFDGPKRRMKQATTNARQDRFPAEWSHLQQYCLYGVLPAAETICKWQDLFPRSRLVRAEITAALRQLRVPIVQCPEEADAFIAAAVTGQQHGHSQAFIVGNDSDFCFFRDCNYIPVHTLDAASSNVVCSAVVLRRDELAASLQLADAQMVDVAIAMGNDYVRQPARAGLNCPTSSTSDILAYFSAQTDIAPIETNQPELQHVLDFCRAFYNLQDLSEFPLDDSSEEDDDDDDDDSLSQDDDAGNDDIAQLSGYRPSVPKEVDISLTKLRPLKDFTILDAVVRCLQDYVNQEELNEDSETCMVTQEQLDVLVQMELADDSATTLVLQDHSWRPLWQDIPAVYLIEQTFAGAFKLNADSPLVRLSLPSTLFDAYKLHALLRVARGASTTSNGIVNGNGGVAESVKATADEQVKEKPPPERIVLPIDEHEETILETIRNNRVSIIQGETGCGKSSRIPIMCLKAPPPDPALGQVKLFISQPRRIAAKALVERVRSVEPELRDAVALRMGHGVREYETSKTRAWFVTTGYLVRLMVNHPQHFNSVSHLIIDEVHERSVDTDILCLLCRRLLHTNQHIRLVLMSATLAAALYQEYFGVPDPPIKVGARRFPVEEVFLEDLIERFALPAKDIKNVRGLVAECDTMRCTRAPSMSYMEKMFSVVSNIAMVLGRPGSSVLIFVSGMNEIVAITELVEQLFVPGVRFTCFPIHSDIPFEDQMAVFEASAADEVKIIIATNAAESSVTLPDVDHVVCLGLCKQIVYNEASHRQMLLSTWISKASATQRAGRTGRLRPGTVYRMYTRDTYNRYMEDFEPGEMLRIPLDSVILMLKEMLSDEDVTDVLLDCLEPPNIDTIDRSFASLFQSHFITSPDDCGDITTLGKFVSALGIDLTLGSLIGLGIQFGVAGEAIQMAAVLSFPKTPWIMSNPLIHETKDYNDMVKKSYVSKCHFDANLYSEPLAAMNLLWEFEQAGQKTNWCWKHALAFPRLKRLAGTADNLRNRVADFIGIRGDLLEVELPPVRMAHAKVTALRVIQTWVLNDTIIYCPPRVATHGLQEEIPTLLLKPKNGFLVQDEHLQQLLDDERHPFSLASSATILQQGSFTVADGDGFSMSTFSPGFEERFVSFAIEKACDLIWYWNEKSIVVIATDEVATADFFLLVARQLDSFGGQNTKSEILAKQNTAGTRRGRAERACGQWTSWSGNVGADSDIRVFQRWASVTKPNSPKKAIKKRGSQITELARYLGGSAQSLLDLKRGIGCDFSGSVSSTINPKFCLISYGHCSAIAARNIDDLFATFGATTKTKQNRGKQAVTFHPTPGGAPLGTRTLFGAEDVHETSWSRPLFDCIPEGARLLSVLASGRRREHLLKVTSTVGEDEAGGAENGATEVEIDIVLESDLTKLSKRWKREGTDNSVYVAENSVPASVLPVQATEPVYCCAANTLEVKGGGLRAEGLTVLPPGRLFLLLCRITFGRFNQSHLEDGTLEDLSIRWLGTNKRPDSALQEDWRRRIRAAVAFHESSIDLGEELVCFPGKVKELQQVFDGVDGHDPGAWDAFSNPFTRDNLEHWKWEYKKPKTQQRNVAEAIVYSKRSDSDAIEGSNDTVRSKKKNGSKDSKANGSSAPPAVPDAPLEAQSVDQIRDFGVHVMDLSARLFATDLPEGRGVLETELPSTNLLSLVVHQFRQQLDAAHNSSMSVDGPDWKIYRVKLCDGRVLFKANFSNTGLPFGKYPFKRYPQWIRDYKPKKQRPSKPVDALDCLPPGFTGSVPMVVGLVQGSEELLFETIESSIRMEAVFWLERQFRTVERHWYQQDVDYMLKRLLQASGRRAKAMKTKKKKKATKAKVEVTA